MGCLLTGAEVSMVHHGMSSHCSKDKDGFIMALGFLLTGAKVNMGHHGIGMPTHWNKGKHGSSWDWEVCSLEVTMVCYHMLP